MTSQDCPFTTHDFPSFNRHECYGYAMKAHSFSLFDTDIGCCAIAWGDKGIAAFQLPEENEARMRAQMLRKAPDAREASPPSEILDVIAKIRALLRGETSDLSDVVLDMDGWPPFNRRVYEVARTIQPGSVLTYGEIAARLGEPPEAARVVGQALGQNPIPVIVPCHRVLAAGGKIGGFSAPGGAMTKRRLLAIEKARMSKEPSLFD